MLGSEYPESQTQIDAHVKACTEKTCHLRVKEPWLFTRARLSASSRCFLLLAGSTTFTAAPCHGELCVEDGNDDDVADSKMRWGSSEEHGAKPLPDSQG